MNAKQLRGMIWKEGFRIEVQDGQGMLIPRWEGAALRDRTRWLLSQHRDWFIAPKPPEMTEGEKEHARKAMAMLESVFGKVEPVGFGREGGVRIPIRSVKDIMPNPHPGEPPF